VLGGGRVTWQGLFIRSRVLLGLRQRDRTGLQQLLEAYGHNPNAQLVQATTCCCCCCGSLPCWAGSNPQVAACHRELLLRAGH
jgi:hypothetical protein